MKEEIENEHLRPLLVEIPPKRHQVPIGANLIQGSFGQFKSDKLHMYCV